VKRGTIKHATILVMFCLGFGAVLAATDMITSDAIKARAMEDRLNRLGQVIPPTLYDNNPVDDALAMKDAQGEDLTVYRAMKAGHVTGVAYEVRGSGYAGAIRVMMGVDTDGRLLGVRVTSHKETPGLGDKIDEKKSDWILRFTGLFLGKPAEDKWKVKKDGGEFDQFAGATITPRGVVGAVRGGLGFFAANKDKLMETN
jgi:electron transport complex protein RnfG